MMQMFPTTCSCSGIVTSSFDFFALPAGSAGGASALGGLSASASALGCSPSASCVFRLFHFSISFSAFFRSSDPSVTAFSFSFFLRFSAFSIANIIARASTAACASALSGAAGVAAGASDTVGGGATAAALEGEQERDGRREGIRRL